MVDTPAEELSDFSASQRLVARTQGDPDGPQDRMLVPRSTVSGRFVRPVLHKALGQESIGWPVSLWVDNCLQLRGSTTEDPSHRFYGNDFCDAFVASGIWVNMCERSIVYNASTAPWQGHGFHSLIQECTTHYSKVATHECPLFAFPYTPICDELRLPMINRGTPAHMKEVFDEPRRSRQARALGFLVSCDSQLARPQDGVVARLGLHGDHSRMVVVVGGAALAEHLGGLG